MKIVGMPAACQNCKRKCPFANASINIRQSCLFVPHDDAHNAWVELRLAAAGSPLVFNEAPWLVLDQDEDQWLGKDGESLAYDKDFLPADFSDAITNDFVFCKPHVRN